MRMMTMHVRAAALLVTVCVLRNADSSHHDCRVPAASCLPSSLTRTTAWCRRDTVNAGWREGGADDRMDREGRGRGEGVEDGVGSRAEEELSAAAGCAEEEDESANADADGADGDGDGCGEGKECGGGVRGGRAGVADEGEGGRGAAAGAGEEEGGSRRGTEEDDFCVLDGCATWVTLTRPATAHPRATHPQPHTRMLVLPPTTALHDALTLAVQCGCTQALSQSATQDERSPCVVGPSA